MAKASKIKLPKEPTRKQRSRAQREARQQRYLFIGLGAVLLVVVGLVIAGVVNAYVLEPRQPVARVNQVAISTLDFQKRVRYQHLNIVSQLNQLDQQRIQLQGDDTLSFYVSQIEQQITQLETQLADPPTLGREVLDDMIDEELIRQEAARRGISIPTSEVDQYIEENFFNFYRVTPTPAPTNTPLPTPSTLITQTPEPTWTPEPSPTPVSQAAFQEQYNNYLGSLSTQSGMNKDDLHRLVEMDILRQRLQDAFIAEVSPEVEQINLRYVLFETGAAEEVGRSLLSGGMAFDEFYTDVDSGSIISTTSGELGWIIVDELGEQFEQRIADQVVALPVSQTTGIITSTYGNSFAFQVVGRETRPLEEYQKQSRGQAAFENWLALKLVVPGLVDYLDNRYVNVTPPFDATKFYAQ
ncbi:MAG: SurA N-terminal domain-containing protein [Thermoflexales bacterium]|nr:SurA N-terminal domain-containing protein [Thermoflexales bacterium]